MRALRNTSGAVIGWVQTAARADTFADARALMVADSSTIIITDNKRVWSKIRCLQQRQRVASAHQEDWDQAARRIHRLQCVHWVKAHLDPQAATVAAAAGGYPHRWHTLNRGADALAAKGAVSHADDPRRIAETIG